MSTLSPTLEPRAAAAIAIALVALVFDLRTRRIPNLLTFGSAALALVVGFAAGGPSGLLQAGVGWLVGAALFFPFFALGGMGAGDVKLVAALGAWLGPMNAVWLAIFSSMAGGAIGLVVALSAGYMRQAAANLWVMLLHWRTAGLSPVPGITLRETSAPRLAYALPIMIGVVLTLWRA